MKDDVSCDHLSLHNREMSWVKGEVSSLWWQEAAREARRVVGERKASECE